MCATIRSNEEWRSVVIKINRSRCSYISRTLPCFFLPKKSKFVSCSTSVIHLIISYGVPQLLGHQNYRQFCRRQKGPAYLWRFCIPRASSLLLSPTEHQLSSLQLLGNPGDQHVSTPPRANIYRERALNAEHHPHIPPPETFASVVTAPKKCPDDLYLPMSQARGEDWHFAVLLSAPEYPWLILDRATPSISPR